MHPHFVIMIANLISHERLVPCAKVKVDTKQKKKKVEET
jgi:hypothetical protein